LRFLQPRDFPAALPFLNSRSHEVLLQHDVKVVRVNEAHLQRPLK
jgi:hypothetical protein